MPADMLSDMQIRNTKPADRIVRLWDGRGLYLEVLPTGARGWRFKYQFAGREKRISLGVYPDITLKDARERRDEAPGGARMCCTASCNLVESKTCPLRSSL